MAKAKCGHERWNDDLRREGWRAYLRIAAEIPYDVDAVLPRCRVLAGHAPPLFESTFRRDLADAGLDPARIDAEVALVHALATASPEVRAQIDAARADHARVVAKLATGAWVRETVWRSFDEATLADAIIAECLRRAK